MATNVCITEMDVEDGLGSHWFPSESSFQRAHREASVGPGLGHGAGRPGREEMRRAALEFMG